MCSRQTDGQQGTGRLTHRPVLPVAVDGEVGAEEQVGEGQQEGLRQRPSIVTVLVRLQALGEEIKKYKKISQHKTEMHSSQRTFLCQRLLKKITTT